MGTELHKGVSTLFNPATPADYKPSCVERLSRRLQRVEDDLTGRQYLMGDAFTVAEGLVK